MIVIGYFMVSGWKFPSLKNLHIRVASFQVVFFTVIAAVFIIFGLLTHFALIFFLLGLISLLPGLCPLLAWWPVKKLRH